MHSDDLDARIRGLVADAVAGAPDAPELPTTRTVAVTAPRRPMVWAGIGIAAAAALIGALVWTGKDSPDGIVPATSDSGSTTSAPVIAWPEGVSVLVASERGIEQVSSEGGSAVVTRVFDDAPVSRAIMLEDGSIVYQRTRGDIEVLTPALQPAGEPLVTDDGSGTTSLEDADAPNGSLRLVYRTPSPDDASSFQLGAWFQPDEPRYTSPPGAWAVGYRRFSIVDQSSVIAATVDDTGQRSTFGFGFGDGEQTAPGFEQPYLVVGNGAGSYAVLRADGKVEMTGVVSGVIADLGDPTLVADIDLRGEWLVAQFTDGSATLVHTADGTEYDVPVANGTVMLSRYALPTTQPTPTTVPTTEPSTSVPSAAQPAMVTTGLNGVWEYGPAGPVQWTTEQMAIAVKAPDGSMIVQRKAGNGEGDNWTIADTLPLRIASPGAEPQDLFEQLMPAADVVPGWYTVHDAATVLERPLLVLDRQAAQSQGIETPNGALLVLDLSTGSLEQIGTVGGWEEGISRLHLAENGLVVGEWYSGVSRGLFIMSILDEVARSAADLGLESQYDDCGDCPRLYTVSRDGSTIAWLDGTTLVRRVLGPEIHLFPDVDLGEFALDATDLSVAGDVAIFDRRYRDLTPPVLVTIDPNAPTVAEQVTSEELGNATRAALL